MVVVVIGGAGVGFLCVQLCPCPRGKIGAEQRAGQSARERREECELVRACMHGVMRVNGRAVALL